MVTSNKPFTIFFCPWFSGVEKQIFSGVFYNRNIIIRNGSYINLKPKIMLAPKGPLYIYIYIYIGITYIATFYGCDFLSNHLYLTCAK